MADFFLCLLSIEIRGYKQIDEKTINIIALCPYCLYVFWNYVNHEKLMHPFCKISYNMHHKLAIEKKRYIHQMYLRQIYCKKGCLLCNKWVNYCMHASILYACKYTCIRLPLVLIFTCLMDNLKPQIHR